MGNRGRRADEPDRHRPGRRVRALARARVRAPTEPAVGSGSWETTDPADHRRMPRRGIKPMEGNEVHAAGNGRVHYGFVGGEILRPADGLFASDLGNKDRTHLELRAQVRYSCVLGETICGG
jgi:hypothetical protein